QWMLLGVPLIIIAVPLAHLILTRVSFRVSNASIPGVREQIASERAKLGPMSRPEWIVTGAFGLAIALWVSREAWKTTAAGPLLTAEVIAMGAALLLFFIPAHRRSCTFVLDWKTLHKRPWDVLALFGGGLGLASAMSKTGLVEAMATG